jgi:hypothetical protein
MKWERWHRLLYNYIGHSEFIIILPLEYLAFLLPVCTMNFLLLDHSLLQTHCLCAILDHQRVNWVELSYVSQVVLCMYFGTEKELIAIMRR